MYSNTRSITSAIGQSSENSSFHYQMISQIRSRFSRARSSIQCLFFPTFISLITAIRFKSSLKVFISLIIISFGGMRDSRRHNVGISKEIKLIWIKYLLYLIEQNFQQILTLSSFLSIRIRRNLIVVVDIFCNMELMMLISWLFSFFWLMAGWRHTVGATEHIQLTSLFPFIQAQPGSWQDLHSNRKFYSKDIA